MGTCPLRNLINQIDHGCFLRMDWAEHLAGTLWGNAIPLEAWTHGTRTTLGAIRDVASADGHVDLDGLPDTTPVMIASGWVVWDDTFAVVWVDAVSAEEAAEEFVGGADWEPSLKDWTWEGRAAQIGVGLPTETAPVVLVIDETHVSVDVPAEEPRCSSENGHEWCAPVEVVGGIRENPGVWGKHSGVVITRVCRNCGWYHVLDTSQGRPVESYREPDYKSRAWLLTLQNEGTVL